MINNPFRQGKKRFYDNTKFPRGFAKSGNFTIAEDALLILYGETMMGIESGQLAPQTAEECHFLFVTQGGAAPATKLERVWLKYIHLSRSRKNFYPLAGRNKPHLKENELDFSPLMDSD
ncbi:DUF413 domain-containing protein [Vibrio ostreicida]|uniref:Macrodomain Ori protein n=1 Tax=Vibrio ostreicida TaxID=526588 RepID=A0ABT8C0J6_9VIBR|nr:DUF413 domain-containing protein [Vibrio ostreicida]MDN3612139.1 DUF413 domain-containing protein [Vibrio ostreicida]NPD08538.1 DUF413 domain-containing protein [Vibrio ostreicida]